MTPQTAPPPVSDLRMLVDRLPLPTPREIYEGLADRGYVGQDAGRRALSLMAHRHVRRLRYLYLDGIPREELPPKDNHLLIGPTGCGKTFAVELLFREALQLPTCIVDVTTLSETGYVGGDVSSVLTRLLYAAHMDPILTRIGIVCLDEFDKLASGSNRAVFSGAGTTKDVTGIGVQRELLKLLESSEVPVSTGLDHSSYHQQMLIPTGDIAFIGAGAFSGLKTVTRRRGKNAGMGFSKDRVRREEIAVMYDADELEDVGSFQAFGFLPELIGRFNRIVPFEPLDEATLHQILDRQVLPGRRRELDLAGIGLEVADDVYDLLIRGALKRQTGARGLGAGLERALEGAVFDAYSEPSASRITLRVEGTQVVGEITGRR